MTCSSSVSAVLMTLNEEKNLRRCLENLSSWTREILVVDSGSTDRTLEVAREFGARVFVHEFETHAKQWRWALASLPIQTEWVLGLDADQIVTAKLRDEIQRFLDGPARSNPQIEGAYVRRRQVFRGKWILHGGYYPKYLLKLFKAGCVLIDEGDLVDHHFRVRGQTVKLDADIIEDNKNEADISIWTAKHNKYAKLQALEEYRQGQGLKPEILTPRALGTPDERTLWLKRLWSRLPLYLRPFIYFTYRYFMRAGFLDGKQGFTFHFLQAFWYRLLVDINLDELRLGQTSTDSNASKEFGSMKFHNADKSTQGSQQVSTESAGSVGPGTLKNA